MILERKPVTMAEVREIVGKVEGQEELKIYLKKFTKLKKDKANALMDEIKGLDNIKIREEHIVKVADFMPQDAEDVGKIFSDAGLTEEEINAILDIVKKY